MDCRGKERDRPEGFRQRQCGMNPGVWVPVDKCDACNGDAQSFGANIKARRLIADAPRNIADAPARKDLRKCVPCKEKMLAAMKKETV